MTADWPREVVVTLPHWAADVARPGDVFVDDAARMALAVRLSRENVVQGTGGPFGAAVFERGSGRLVAVGVNRVVPLGNSSLHGEMVAFMVAQHRLGSFTLRSPGGPEHELFTSCEPCAMCLGGTLWSGVTRLVYAATREDAARLHFDEGPVFPESYRYLERRGIEVVREVMRAEAATVLEAYRAGHGTIYNA